MMAMPKVVIEAHCIRTTSARILCHMIYMHCFMDVFHYMLSALKQKKARNKESIKESKSN